MMCVYVRVRVNFSAVLCLILTFSIEVLVLMARPCSISGAVKAHASSVIVQFLNANVPFADKSSDVGLMMLQMLLCPGELK